MQGLKGRIELAVSLAVLGFWSCSFPNYGFVDEPSETMTGTPGSDMGSPPETNGGEAGGGAGGEPNAQVPSGGQAGEGGDPGPAGGEAGSGGGAVEVLEKTCSNLEDLPVDCRCWDYHDHAYLFCTTARTWAGAAEVCAAAGTQLVALEGPSENTWLVTRIEDDGNSSEFASFWIGGKSDGDSWVYRWPDQTAFWEGQADGMLVDGSYANWHNTNPKQGGCVSMREGRWEDGDCESPRPYVCEAY